MQFPMHGNASSRLLADVIAASRPSQADVALLMIFELDDALVTLRFDELRHFISCQNMPLH